MSKINKNVTQVAGEFAPVLNQATKSGSIGRSDTGLRK
jgi:hypothetical protein